MVQTEGIIERVVRWTIRKKKIVYVLVSMLVVAGIGGLWFMNKDEFPAFTIKQGLVVGVYPGADAAEVEEHLTSNLEDMLCRIPEVKRDNMKSISEDGICYIYTDLECKVSEKDEVWSKIKLKLQAEKVFLPKGVLAVTVLDDFNSISSVLIALESDDKGYSELQEYADDLKLRLGKIPDLGKVQIIGSQEEEIAVTVDPDILSSYGISPSSLMLGYQSATLEMPASSFKTEETVAPIRVNSNVCSEQEIAEKIVYIDPTGKVIRLKDIATIDRRYKEPDKYVTYNGHSCLVLAVDMRNGKDNVSFGKDVDKVLAEFRKDTPKSVTMSRISDQPKVVEDSVTSFLSDLVLSMLVVIAVMLSLFSLKSAVIAGSGVPICTALTLAIMFFTHMDVNTVTLAALIVVLGMIVDNSIITMDGYMNCLKQGMSREDAAVKSIKELFAPTLTATLAISLMFFPAKHIIKGYIGEFISFFPWVILIALLVSLIYAVVVVPSLEVHYITSANPVGKGIIPKAQNILFRSLERGYAVAERFCFNHPYLTIGTGIVTLVVSLIMFSQTNIQMMPKAARDFFAVEIELESGNSLKTTKAVVDSLQKVFLADERIKSVTAFVGTGAPRFVTTYAPILPSERMAQLIVNTESNEATQQILKEWEDKYEHLFPQAIIRYKQMDYQDVEAPVMITLTGNDRESMYDIADKIRTYMFTLDDQVQWVHSSTDDSKPSVHVDLDNQEAARLGVNKAMLSLAMAGTFNGLNLGVIMDEGDYVPVNLYSTCLDDNLDFEKIEDQMVMTTIPGVSVPLRQVASVRADWDRCRLERFATEPSITLFADLKYGVSQPSVMSKIDKFIKENIDLPKDVNIEYNGLTSSNNEIVPYIVEAIIAAISVLILFMLFHFKKMSLAILTLVMSTLCLFGAFFGLWVFKLDFGITAVLGLISLIGIIVRNGIIMYEYAEELRFEHGLDVKTAAMEAGARRMKPIFLTSCTTALGVLPMIWGGDLLWMPMGVTICFGTILSILLIVFVMPVSYWQVFKRQDRKRMAVKEEVCDEKE